ncbi:MAG: PTS system mannose/fructose/sorbose family transporter subunit IID [Clostridium sp.]|nr:PTS system mannose/fructose/sorbose family transporter subunit IID [Enterocloster asparagiformis]MCD7906321.1 PTS system mannose/fructose/sorbose family transporter subunit IID [Clostridium sp.]
MAKNEIISAENNLTKKDFVGVFWRSFTLLGSFNYERMEGLGFLYAVMPVLRKIYKDDDESLRAAMHRHIAAFNMTVAPSPFVMGTTIAMEEKAKRDKSFDVASINAIKVSLMGPLSGIGDTFFWGIFRILACALAVGFAKEGNILAPFVLLLFFNIPNFLTRWFGLFIGYRQGHSLLSEMQATGRVQLFTHCAGIIGAMSIGCMIAMWVSISCPLQFTIAGSEIVLQEYLDQILPKLLPLAFTLGIFACIKKKMKVTAIIGGIVVVGFILGILGLIAM